jgi:hypothetical protein
MTEAPTPAQNWPDEVRALGTLPKANYKVNLVRLLLVLAGGLFLAGLALFIALEDDWPWWRLIPAGMVAFYSVSFLIQAWHNCQPHVMVFPQGFASWQDGKWIACRWDEIEAVLKDEERNVHVSRHPLHAWSWTKCFIIVFKHGGQHILLSEFLENIQALGETIVEESYQRLWPKVMEAYQRGDTLDFGPVKVNQSGMIYKKQLLPWQDVKTILITPEFIKIIKKGSWLGYWADLHAGAIPNFSVFWTVLEHTGLIAKPE